MFPLPENFIPDRFAEIQNLIDYPALVRFIKEGRRQDKTIFEIEGMAAMLKALEAQRKRDLEDWMDVNGFDAVIFPANGDVGRADLEENVESAQHALQNGVKYGNGNRAIKHLGVPTVSVTMGKMEGKKMPVNLTICGKAGSDADLLRYAHAYEQQSQHRTAPSLVPALQSDNIPLLSKMSSSLSDVPDIELKVTKSAKRADCVLISGIISPASAQLSAFVDGVEVDEDFIKTGGNGEWEVRAPFVHFDIGRPAYADFEGGEIMASKVMIVLLAHMGKDSVRGELVLV